MIVILIFMISLKTKKSIETLRTPALLKKKEYQRQISEKINSQFNPEKFHLHKNLKSLHH